MLKLLELARSKVMVTDPPGRITVGEKVLLIVGRAITESVPKPAVPVLALSVAMGPVLLISFPGFVAVTGTTMEQLPAAGIIPPEISKEPPPFIIITVPPQVLEEGDAAVLTML